MAEARIVLRYDGQDAAENRVSMRLLGSSLIGVERAIQEGLWIATNPGVPLGRKRSDLSVQVYAPSPGCVEIAGIVAPLAGHLPYAYDVATGLGTNYLWHLLSAVLQKHGGRPVDAARHMDQMLEIIADQQRAATADRQLERAAIERLNAKTLGTIETLVTGMQRQARDIVAPVGPSAASLILPSASRTDTTVIDVPMAEAIRSSVPLEVGDMEDVTIRFDELDRGKRKARVELVSDPGHFVGAEIRDPSYEEFPNAYSSAFNEGREIQVLAKLSRRKEDGALVKLHIMDTR